MFASQYYASEDSDMASVIIEAQHKMYNDVREALNNQGYGTSDQEVEDAVKELCRVTLS